VLTVATVATMTSFAPAALAASTGTISIWGANDTGQLGIGAGPGRTSPGPGPSYSNITAIAGGRDNMLALRSDGSVVAWGHNNFGQVGDGTTTDRSTPVVVTGLPSVAAVFAGHYHSMALTSSGALYAWGDNATGQLGLGNTKSQSRPTLVPVGAPIASADGGADQTIALGTDGTVWTWGDNAYGEVGDGTTTMRTSPVHLTSLTGVVEVAAARDSDYAVTSSGQLYAWGRNDFGQLGLGDTTNRNRPTLVPGISGVQSVSAGAFNAVAVLADGTVRAWGDNQYGEVGDGTTTKRLTPVIVPGLSGATYVETGRDSCFVITSDGVLHAWGRNDEGQLGDGTTTNRLSPVTIGITGVTQIAAGHSYTAALVAGTPDTQPPTVPGTPSAASSSPGTVTLTWAASTDDRATTIIYSVFRDGGATAVGTVSSASTGTVSFTDTGLAGGSMHTYQVSASDGTNSSALSPASNQVTVEAGSPAVFSDDFSNGLTGWSSAGVSLDQTTFPPGGAAPSLHGATSNAPQWATHPLGGSYSSLCVQAEVDLASVSTNTSLLRFRSGSIGVARVFVTPAHLLALRSDVSGKSFVSTTPLPLGGWHNLQLCTTVGTAVTISGWLDGKQVITATSSTGTAPITLLQLGDTTNVTMTANYDNVVVVTN
jgi:alpha-tubulin suppressor-like RCC1 family protein